MLRVAALLTLVALVYGEAEAKPDYPAARPPTSYGAPPAPAPSYGPPPAPAPSYGPPPPAPSYGPPPKPKSYCHKKCYDKTTYTTITKTAKEHHTSWMTQNQVLSRAQDGFNVIVLVFMMVWCNYEECNRCSIVMLLRLIDVL